MKQTKKIAAMSFALSVVWLSVLFQNCSSGGFAAPSAQPASTVLSSTQAQAQAQASGTGNGHGYDGKLGIYVSQLKPGSLCPDGSNISGKIEVTSSSQAFLLRQDCIDIAPSPIAFSQLTSLNSQFMLFGFNAYQFAPSIDPQNTALFVCTNQSSVSPITVAIYSGFTTLYLAQFTVPGLQSQLFPVDMLPLGIAVGYVGTSPAGDQLSLPLTGTSTTGAYPAALDLRFGPLNSTANTNLTAVPMTCYRQAR